MKKQNETLIKFGLKLKVERVKRGLSQENLAELSDLSPSCISQFESGKQNITLANIKSVADALGMTMSELLDIENI